MDKKAEEFTVRNDYLLDQKLVRFDCLASIAHAKTLEKALKASADKMGMGADYTLSDFQIASAKAETSQAVDQVLGPGYYTAKVGAIVCGGCKVVIEKTMRQVSGVGAAQASAAALSLTQTNWLAQPAAEKIYQAQVRYHGERHSVKIKTTAYRKAAVTFQGAAPLVAAGQSLVVYDGPTLLGGGVIS